MSKKIPMYYDVQEYYDELTLQAKQKAQEELDQETEAEQ
jgi:hypothetical protein